MSKLLEREDAMGSQKLTNVLLILVLGCLVYLSVVAQKPVTVGRVTSSVEVTGEGRRYRGSSPIDVNVVNEPLGVDVQSMP